MIEWKDESPLHLSKMSCVLAITKKIDIDGKISSLLGHILLPKEDILSIGERDRSSAGHALS